MRHEEDERRLKISLLTAILGGGALPAAAPPSLLGVNFPAITDYYTYSTGASWNGPNSASWCVGFWFRWDDSATTQFQQIFSAGSVTPWYGVNLIGSPNAAIGRINWQIQATGDGSAVTCQSDIVLPNPADGKWRLLICERDWTRLRMRMWIAEVGGAPELLGVQSYVTSTGAVPASAPTVGHRSDLAATRHFGGSVRNFFKLNSLLTQDEMFKLACGADIMTDLGKSPTVYTKYDAASATLTDASGNGNTATRAGSPVATTAIPLPTNIISAGGINAQKRVFRKDLAAAQATLSFSIGYRGRVTAPQYRIINAGTLAVVTNWTAIATAMPQSDVPAVVTMSAVVPAGGFYQIETRGSGLVEADKTLRRTFGVGYVILCIGQSNMDRLFVNTVLTAPIEPNVVQRNLQACIDAVSPFNKPATLIGKALFDASGYPVELINGSKGGTALLLAADTGSGYWLDQTAGSPYANAVLMLSESGNLLSGGIWSQGEQDGSFVALDQPAYLTAMKTVFDRVRTAVGYAAMPFRVAVTGPTTGSITFESSMAGVRNKQVGYPATDTNAKVGMSQMDAYLLGDTIHPDNLFYIPMSKRWGQSALEMVGLSAVSGIGPTITGCSLSGSTATVTVTHAGGTALVVPRSAQLIDGFEFSVDDFASTIPYTASAVANATQMTFTFAAPPTPPLKVRYGQKISHSVYTTLGSNPITTVNASPTVSIAWTAHGLVVGDRFNLNSAGTVGGLVVGGSWVVASVPDANTITYTFGSNATSGATGGGAAVTIRRYNIVVDNNLLASETTGQPIQPLLTMTAT